MIFICLSQVQIFRNIQWRCFFVDLVHLPSARCLVSWPIYQAIFLEEKCWFDINKILKLIPFMFHVWLFFNTKSVTNYPEEEVEEEEEEEDRRRRPRSTLRSFRTGFPCKWNQITPNKLINIDFPTYFRKLPDPGEKIPKYIPEPLKQ